MSNNSSTSDENDCVSHKTFKLVSGIVFCLSGTFMNGSILLALLRRSQLSIVNTMIFHLTLSDMVVFLANGPYLFLSFFNQRLAFSPLICQIGAFIGRYTTTVSMYLLTVMSLSRFYSLAKPLEYRVRVTASKANKVCIGAWLVTFLLSLTPVLGWGKYTAIKGQCYCALDSSKHMSNWFAHLFLAFVLPLAVNSWSFARTIRLVKIRNRKLKKGRPKGTKTSLSKIKQKCTSSVDEKGIDNGQSNKDDITFNKRNQGQPKAKTSLSKSKQKCTSSEDEKGIDNGQSNKQDDVTGVQKCEVVDLEVVARVNEETTEKPAFVNQGFEDEDVKNNPADDIHAKARINEQHESDEIKVVHQGIEIQNHETVSTDERDHEIFSVVNAEAADRENPKTHRKHSQQKNESEKMKKNQYHKDKSSKLQEQKYELKINTIVSLLFIAYVIGCGPTYVVWTWFALDPKSVPRTVFVIFRWFAGLQSLVNPFIYGFMNAEIRADVLALWKNAPRCVF